MKKLFKYLIFAPVVLLLLANVNDLFFTKRVTFGPQIVSAFHPCGGGNNTPTSGMVGHSYNVCQWAFDCNYPLEPDTWGIVGFNCEPGDPWEECDITWCNYGCGGGGDYYCLGYRSGGPPPPEK